MGNRLVAALVGVLVSSFSLAAVAQDPATGSAPRADVLPDPSSPPPGNAAPYAPPEYPSTVAPFPTTVAPYPTTGTPYPGPPTTATNVAYAPDYRGPRRVSGPMIGGLVLVGAGYGLSLVTGIFSVLIGAGTRCDRCTPYGRWMFLPVAGPWVAMAREAESRPGRVYAGVLGGTQSLGVLLLGIGAILNGHRRSTPPPVMVGIRPDGVELGFRF